MSEDNPLTYKQAGVDIEAGYEAVRRIRDLARSTYRPEVADDIGRFGGLFGLSGFNDPVLVAGTDGVGTKLRIAFMMNKHNTVGIDLVAYCVNDIICQGAEPLFFLDYLSLGRLDPEVVEELVRGIATGCRMAGCALIGGETAEMPGFYAENEYDMAGFAVGVVERDKLLDGSAARAGDVLIGIRSTGLQSSGFSLVRKVLFDVKRHDTGDEFSGTGKTLGEELLTPTGIYARQILELQAHYRIKGIANISGGGMYENIPRSLPENVHAVVRKDAIEPHPIFGFIQAEGHIAEEEMYRTFNMGVAMVLVADASDAGAIVSDLTQMGETAAVLGEVEAGPGDVVLV